MITVLRELRSIILSSLISLPIITQSPFSRHCESALGGRSNLIFSFTYRIYLTLLKRQEKNDLALLTFRLRSEQAQGKLFRSGLPLLLQFTIADFTRWSWI